jgi:hypothetical protein
MLKIVGVGDPVIPEDPESFFKVTSDVIRAGAFGVAYGRNIFQAEDPARMVIALKSIIHEGNTADQARDVLRGRKHGPIIAAVFRDRKRTAAVE